MALHWNSGRPQRTADGKFDRVACVPCWGIAIDPQTSRICRPLLLHLPVILADTWLNPYGEHCRSLAGLPYPPVDAKGLGTALVLRALATGRKC